jgi:hypothetical protein
MIHEIFIGRAREKKVTFNQTVMNFSSRLCKEENLLEFKGVKIGVDEELHRIYLGFSKVNSPGLSRLYVPTKIQHTFRLVAVTSLYSHFPWIKKVVGLPLEKRKFKLHKNQEEETKKYQYYIDMMEHGE